MAPLDDAINRKHNVTKMRGITKYVCLVVVYIWPVFPFIYSPEIYGHIDGLEQDCSNSSALAMELLWSYYGVTAVLILAIDIAIFQLFHCMALWNRVNFTAANLTN